MTDTTQVLLNQVEHLENFDGYVRKSDVIDLIYGVENDLYNMSDRRALEQVRWLLQHRIDETLEVMWELEDMDLEDDPFVRIYEEVLQGYFLDISEDYYNDLVTAEEVISFELEDLE